MSPDTAQLIAALQGLPRATADAIAAGPLGQALNHLTGTQRGNPLQPAEPRVKQPSAFQATQRLLYATGAGQVAGKIAQAKELYDAVSGFVSLFTRKPEAPQPPQPPPPPPAPAAPAASALQNVHIVSPLPLPVRLLELPPINPVGPHPMASGGSPWGPVGPHPLATGPAPPGYTPPTVPQRLQQPLYPPHSWKQPVQPGPQPGAPGAPPAPAPRPAPMPSVPLVPRPAGIPATSPLAPAVPKKPVPTPRTPRVWAPKTSTPTPTPPAPRPATPPPAAAAATVPAPRPTAPAAQTPAAPATRAPLRLDEANRLSFLVEHRELNKLAGDIVGTAPPAGRKLPELATPPAPASRPAAAQAAPQAPKAMPTPAPASVPHVPRGRWDLVPPSAPTMLAGRRWGNDWEPSRVGVPTAHPPYKAPRDPSAPRVRYERPVTPVVAPSPMPTQALAPFMGQAEGGSHAGGSGPKGESRWQEKVVELLENIGSVMEDNLEAVKGQEKSASPAPRSKPNAAISAAAKHGATPVEQGNITAGGVLKGSISKMVRFGEIVFGAGG